MVEANRLHHLGFLHGIELLEASFERRQFPRHAHDAFAIGAILDGVGGYECRGETHVLPPGRLSLMNPGEVHTGCCIAGALRYNMLYLPEAAVAALIETPAPRGFREITPADPDGALARSLACVSAALNAPERPGSRLWAEECVLEVVRICFTRYGGAPERRAGSEPVAVRRVRETLDEAATGGGEELNLDVLATIAGLHPSYLAQVFTRALGISPHAYLIQRRLACAKTRLLAGEKAADVAVSLGFYDQPHFIRRFRQVFGVTPGKLVRH